MISLKARAEMLSRTEAELKSEMAASLGRIGRTLENLIARLQDIRRKFPEIEEEKRKQYRELHDQAQLYYWYLIVQREAIGIRNHDILIQMYRIPDKI
jgi:predicted nuclease with TOPRIM domain